MGAKLGRNPSARAGLALGLTVLAATWAAAGDPPLPTPSPTPTPNPSPAPTPSAGPASPPSPLAGPPRPRLRLDLERHVQKQVEEEARAAPPRFEESVEVEAETPQSILERHLRGVPLDCGPAAGGGGAPTETEMRAVRPHGGPSIDLLPLAKKLRDRMRKEQPDRYFLYRVTRPEGVRHDLRAERVPDSWRYTNPGTTFELLEGFPDLGDAARALRRLEQGFDRAVSTLKESPPQPWATQQPCRPR